MLRPTLLALAALAVAWPYVSAAAGPTDRTLAFGIFAVPGFHDQEPDGRLSGRAIDALARLAHASGLDASFRFLPRARIVPELVAGGIDVAILGEASHGEATLIDLGQATTLEIVAISRKGLLLRGRDDLAGLKVAARRATTVDRFLPGTSGPDLIEVNDFAQSLRLLARGRVDALVTSCQGIEATALAEGIAREDLGSFMPLGSLPLHGYASPLLAGTAKLDRLAQAFGTFPWHELAQTSSWCGGAER